MSRWGTRKQGETLNALGIVFLPKELLLAATQLGMARRWLSTSSAYAYVQGRHDQSTTASKVCCWLPPASQLSTW